MADPADVLRHAMDAQGVTDNDTRAGIAAICMGESGMLGHVETGYGHTSDARIRAVFGDRVSNLTDAQLDEIKASDETWFEFVYGPQTRTGRVLGNTLPGDGFKYRGRGGLQITGRSNYTQCARMIGRPDVIDDPDIVASDPDVGMAMSVAFIRLNYHGGGFDRMLRCVGWNTPDIEARKRAYYFQYLNSGEFSVDPAEAEARRLRVLEFQREWNREHPGQMKLVEDGIAGPKTKAAGYVDAMPATGNFSAGTVRLYGMEGGDNEVQ